MMMSMVYFGNCNSLLPIGGHRPVGSKRTLDIFDVRCVSCFVDTLLHSLTMSFPLPFHSLHTLDDNLSSANKSTTTTLNHVRQGK